MSNPVAEYKSGNHILICTENETDQNFFCVQCQVKYENVLDFMTSHKGIEEKTAANDLEDWENFDDLIEYDASGEENDIVEAQADLDYCSENSTEKLLYVQTEELDANETTVKIEDDVGDNKYFCYDCRTVFTDLQIAEQHDCPGIGNALEEDKPSMTSIENSSNILEEELVEYMCAYCEKKFLSLVDLEQHQVSCDSSNIQTSVSIENEQIQSAFCPKMVAPIKALNSHSRVHKTKQLEDTDNLKKNQLESCTCHICNTQFANLRSLKLHLRIHNERPIRRLQEALPKAEAQNYNRLNHFFCEICNKSFDQNLLIVHKSMHQNIEDHICKICNRQFKNKESFEMHQQLHMSAQSEDAPVLNCGPTNAALRNSKKGVKSMRVANAKKTFPCQYCGHLFWRPHEKVRHEHVHTGEKPYPCEVCGKRFRVPYSLTLHLRTHTDIRPYVCATCNKRFKSHSVYTHHLRTHLNDRAYQCDICGKSFRTTVQLYGHKNNHIKPFNCTLCNRPFASLFAVKSHMKSHSKSKTFENSIHSCDICGAVYGALRALRAHKKEIHAVETTKTFQSTLRCQSPEEMHSEDDHYEADEAAMMLLEIEPEVGNKKERVLSKFINNESLDGLSVDHYYLNKRTTNEL